MLVIFIIGLPVVHFCFLEYVLMCHSEDEGNSVLWHIRIVQHNHHSVLNDLIYTLTQSICIVVCISMACSQVTDWATFPCSIYDFVSPVVLQSDS